MRQFFSLWPPPEIAGRIARARDQGDLCGRAVRCERLHLTLAFLGDLAPSSTDRLLAAAGAIEAAAFTLELARVGYFDKPQIAWLGPVAVPPEITALVSELRRACARVGIELPQRRFRPHVTLARRARKPARVRLAEVVSWPVTTFHLTESTQAGGKPVYRDLGCWPLACRTGD